MFRRKPHNDAQSGYKIFGFHTCFSSQLRPFRLSSIEHSNDYSSSNMNRPDAAIHAPARYLNASLISQKNHDVV